jgi:hypothetical protein
VSKTPCHAYVFFPHWSIFNNFTTKCAYIFSFPYNLRWIPYIYRRKNIQFFYQYCQLSPFVLLRKKYLQCFSPVLKPGNYPVAAKKRGNSRFSETLAPMPILSAKYKYSARMSTWPQTFCRANPVERSPKQVVVAPRNWNRGPHQLGSDSLHFLPCES